MFHEKNLGVVGFESCWKNEKSSKNESIQTTEFSTNDKNFNTKQSKTIEVQTDPIKNTIDNTNFEMERLATWLKNIYPKMSNELNDNSLSNAFATSQNFKPSTATIKVLQKLDVNLEKNNEKIYVSALSWSCTGNTLAVSCSFKHDIWCYHEGEIKIYTYTRSQKLLDVPSKKLKCASCVTCLNFHPNQPSILASGTFSGEIYLWSLKTENENLLSSYTGHEDRVTQISWILLPDPKSNFTLISSSLDSFLLTWKINESILAVDQRYKCKNYTTKFYNNPADVIPKKTERGIVCFDFSRHFPGLFIVGTEGGYVLKCSLIGAKIVPGNKSVLSFLDPFVSNFSSHDGEVSNISFSPNRKELFLSCGTDDQIKIFHIDQESPVQIIFTDVTVNLANWITCEQKLLVGVADNGSLKLFSMLNGQQISTNATFTNQPITSMALNNKRSDVLAVGNNEAIVTLWSIPWNDIALNDKRNVFKTQ